jgi:hypothetical protein
MSLVYLLLRTFFALVSLFFLTCFVIYSLPHPLNSINIILLTSVVYFLYKEKKSIFWFSALFHFFLELYSIHLFGLLIFSSSVALLVFFWVYKQVLTNTSWYAVSVLILFVVGVYKMVYGALFYLQKIFFSSGQSLLFREYIVSSMQEMVYTAIAGGVVYVLIFYVILPQKKQKKIFRL